MNSIFSDPTKSKPLSASLVSSGEAYPLGATANDQGTNFALFSANATKVELCIFDSEGKNEIQRIELPEFSDDVWHGFIYGLKVGTVYGYRVHGPFEPHNGHRFNSSKLLIDPYAKQLKGEFICSDTHLSYDPLSSQQDLTLDFRDNANYLPKCVVQSDGLSSSTNEKNTVKIALSENIIYELHVKGFTQNNSKIPLELRGTFKGLSDKSVMQHLTDLGITSVELMPVAAFFDESFLVEKELSNYWGYNSIAFFAPEPRYCFSDDLEEFKQLVECFHQAGIEVILDVVYNHTAEGDHLGPTYSFKGIDNASYYRLEDNNRRFYKNYSGCGNTLNLQHPRVLQMVMDSLRYWVEIMGVDGFRFDLAPILGRGRQGKDDFVDYSSFFAAARQDPVLTHIKLIAEPWDIGPAGYQLGRFPTDWLEWNDRFRDTLRRFWRGDEGILPEIAKRLHGSNDIFSQKGRRPYSSVNFITSHDGFTLNDLVSYKHQHNHANGEENNDGHSANFSDNYGAEGTTDEKHIISLREKQKRNMLATLLLAQGTPMLLGGDEFGNSQDGNNNAYCQDNSISWLDWQSFHDNTDNQSQLTNYAFVKKLIQLRKENPLLNRNSYQHGMLISDKTGLPDISWLNSNGLLMNQENWNNRKLKCFGMLLANVQNSLDNEKIYLVPNAKCSIEYGKDDALLIIFNAHRDDVEFKFPELNGQWKIIVDTANEITLKNNTTDLITNNRNITKEERMDGYVNLLIAAKSCVVLNYNQDIIQEPTLTKPKQ